MTEAYQGQCTCGSVAFKLPSRPLFNHACHCSWCQRETGSAFICNGIIEAHQVVLTKGEPILIETPSHSGAGQKIARCPTCQIALWSIYSGAGPRFLFIRMGTLDDAGAFPPDIHIFTSSKQPWLQLPKDARVMKGYYKRENHWPASSLARRDITIAMSDAEAVGPVRR